MNAVFVAIPMLVFKLNQVGIKERFYALQSYKLECSEHLILYIYSYADLHVYFQFFQSWKCQLILPDRFWTSWELHRRVRKRLYCRRRLDQHLTQTYSQSAPSHTPLFLFPCLNSGSRLQNPSIRSRDARGRCREGLIWSSQGNNVGPLAASMSEALLLWALTSPGPAGGVTKPAYLTIKTVRSLECWYWSSRSVLCIHNETLLISFSLQPRKALWALDFLYVK